MSILSLIPAKLTHFNLFVNGIGGYAGMVKELTPPKLTIKTDDYRSGGMDGSVPIDMGLEKLEAEATLDQFDPNIMRLYGFKMGGQVSLTFRGALTRPEATIPLSLNMDGRLTELDMGSWKPGDDNPFKFKMYVTYYKVKMAEIEVIEIDIENMVRKIGGEDQMLGVRAALLR